MRNVFCLLAVAGVLVFSGCGAKKTEESTVLDPETNATDIAETAAAPVDTAGLLLTDSAAADSTAD